MSSRFVEVLDGGYFRSLIVVAIGVKCYLFLLFLSVKLVVQLSLLVDPYLCVEEWGEFLTVFWIVDFPLEQLVWVLV